MKNSFLIIFIILCGLMASCQNTPNRKGAIDAQKQTRESLEMDLDGIWVNTAFVDCIKQTKSPYTCQSEQPYFTMTFDKEHNLDGYVVAYTDEYGQTEALPVYYYKWEDQDLLLSHALIGLAPEAALAGDSCVQDCARVKIQKEDGNMKLLVNIPNVWGEQEGPGKQIVLEKITTPCIDDAHPCHIFNVIAEHLLEGNYQLLDASNKVISEHIAVDKNGLITGFEKYQRAVLWQSFREVNGEFTFDVLEFIPKDQPLDRYGWFEDKTDHLFKFEIKEDKIVLSTIVVSPEWVVSAEEVKYYLVRKD